jgi:hypothetical protein
MYDKVIDKVEDFQLYLSEKVSDFNDSSELDFGYLESRLGRNSEVVADGGEIENYDHLDDVPDGAGCTEIWEKLSDDRDPLEER